MTKAAIEENEAANLANGDLHKAFQFSSIFNYNLLDYSKNEHNGHCFYKNYQDGILQYNAK